jgi:E3 ubiquitin-protein ligase HUWE1
LFLPAGEEVYANETFRNLITLHVRVTLLSDVFATSGYTHGRSAISVLQTLMSGTPAQVISDLGSLHRATIWENLTLKTGLTEKGINVPMTPNTSSPLDGTPEQTSVPLPEGDRTDQNAPNGAGGADEPSASVTPSAKDPAKPQSPRDRNALALKHWSHNIPGSLTPFFQGKSHDCDNRNTLF